MDRSVRRMVRVAMVLAGLQLARLGAIRFFILASQGKLSTTFAVTAGTGDVLIAITAPMIVWGLYRGGPRAWTWVVVWNIAGIVDLIAALGIGFMTNFPMQRHLPVIADLSVPLSVVPLVAVPCCVGAHVVSLILLCRKDVRGAMRHQSPSPDSTQAR